MSSFRWRTVDIVVASIIAVAFGVIFWAWGLLWYGPFTTAFTFFPPAAALVNGVWFVPVALAPLIIRQIADIITNLKRSAMTMLLVEQNFALATEVADQIVVLGKGRVRWTGTSEELRQADDVRHTWLGI